MATIRKEDIEDSLDKARKALKSDNLVDSQIYLFASLKASVDLYEKANHYNSNNQDSHFVHYTGVETIYSILKNYNHNTVDSKQDKKEQSKKNDLSLQYSAEGKEYLRLYDAFYFNDPNEGKFLRDNLEKRYKWIEDAKEESDVFICSFFHGDGKTGDRLAHWQSYGKDGLGCSIQLSQDYRFKKHLKPILYGEDGLNKITKEGIFDKHFCLGEKIHKNLEGEESTKFATKFWQCFDKIKFLYKSDDYKDEKECRFIKFDSVRTEVKYELKKEGPYLRRFLLDEKLKANEVLNTGSIVVIGPAVRKANHLCYTLKKLAEEKKLPGPQFSSSKIPYQKFW